MQAGLESHSACLVPGHHWKTISNISNMSPVQLPLRSAWMCCSRRARAHPPAHRHEQCRCHSCHRGRVLQPLLPLPPAKPKVPGILAQLCTPTASIAHPQHPSLAGPLAGAALRPLAQLELAGQHMGRGCIGFTIQSPACSPGHFPQNCRACSSLELAVAQAGQSSPTLQESNHRLFRQFLFSASTQLQAECK